MQSALFLLFCAVFSLPSLAGDVISLRSDEYCPYNCQPGSDKPGYMVEMARQIFERNEMTVDYQLLNWARAVEEARQGRVSGLLAAFENGRPELLVYPAEPAGKLQQCFYTLASRAGWQYRGLSSLKGIQLGLVNGYLYGPAIEAYAKDEGQNRVQYAIGDNPLQTNLAKLQKGRIDALLEDRNVIHYLLQTQPDLALRESGCSDWTVNMHVAFSRADPQSDAYARQWSQGVAALRRSGELKRILARYGLSDWKKP